jgi:hypothetical protein
LTKGLLVSVVPGILHYPGHCAGGAGAGAVCLLIFISPAPGMAFNTKVQSLEQV